ncbi:hypothetical protein PPACK8108_LOCUS8818 [Phakopsora pachyrhizi]|uniref:Uncharacterized protein n=1 Tax=Phakopsora pachyrhizi TaxID=170000 RepID=A0AAV0AXT7_PHAPC|nr:hypothetical protein PPACK8108_LOCUS8818 [Phakopsora pachyrhizi]
MALLTAQCALLSKIFLSSINGLPTLIPLVKHLQEYLGSLKGFEVLTAVASTPDDSRQSTALILVRKLKIRLEAAEGTDIPKNCENFGVCIHAIATFQAVKNL